MNSRTITVREFLVERWLPTIEMTIRPNTFVSYSSHLSNHVVDRIGDMNIDEVDGPALNALYAELLRAGRRRGKGKALSPTTVRRVHATLRRAFKDAVRWGLLDKNPVLSCDPPRLARNNAMRTWTLDELKQFLETTRRDELHSLWVLLATTGMRRGEALGLKWSHIDLDRKLVAIRQTLILVGARPYFSEPKSARSRRVIVLDTTTAETLATTPRRSELVFTDPTGEPLHPGAVSKRFRDLVCGTDLPRIRLHDLRHTYATLALQAGVHPKIVSERLGHSTIALTLDVYSHALPTLQHEAADRVAALIFGK
ncbi:MAG: tyrosine-type recombinase/integrase [Actinomycetota bacterium]